MKLFSLLKKKEVHLTPGVKVIPARSFTIMQNAAEILEKTEDEAKNYCQAAIEEGERIKEQAFAEGYQDGLHALSEHIAHLEQVAQNINQEIEQKMVLIAIKAVQKILGTELKLHPEQVVKIVKTVLKTATQYHDVTIYVSRKDLDILEMNKDKLKAILVNAVRLSLQERSDLKQGDCIIETEAGIINARLENHWHALTAAFEKYLKE
jgi:type III secretion protein L